MFITSGGSSVRSENIVDGEIVNADISASAAIAASKLTGLPYETLADVNLSSPATQLLSGTFVAKTFLRVLIFVPSTASGGAVSIQFNADTGANYSWGTENDNAAGSYNSTQTSAQLGALTNTDPRFIVLDILNIATVAKRGIGALEIQTALGEASFVWNNTSNQITAIRLFAGSNLGTGTRMVVLGMD